MSFLDDKVTTSKGCQSLYSCQLTSRATVVCSQIHPKNIFVNGRMVVITTLRKIYNLEEKKEYQMTK